MPTSVNSCLGASVSTPTRSPTWIPAALASDAFTAISSSAAGPRPERSWIRSDVPVQFVPRRGGPKLPTTLPSWPMTRAPSASAMPRADATPSTPRTCATRPAGTVAVVVSSPPAGGLACTTTSVCANTVVNRLSNDRPKVSVRTNAPDTNITPSTTARPDSTSRSLRESRLFRVARSIRPPPPRCLRCQGASSCPGRRPASARAARSRTARRRGR